MTVMDIFRLVLGIAMLVAGRGLFWLFLGGVGFVFGFDLAKETMQSQPQSVIFIIAVCIGVAGAMLAIFFQKIAILFGGFLAGGYMLVELLKKYGGDIGHHHWLLFILGGLIGALLMRLLFGWTLIVLSSFIGAGLIIGSFNLGANLKGLFFILLLVLGIAVQSGLLKHSHPRNK